MKILGGNNFNLRAYVQDIYNIGDPYVFNYYEGDKSYYFKYPGDCDRYSNNNAPIRLMFLEVLMSYITRSLGWNSVTYDIGIYDGNIGVCSNDFKQKIDGTFYSYFNGYNFLKLNNMELNNNFITDSSFRLFENSLNSDFISEEEKIVLRKEYIEYYLRCLVINNYDNHNGNWGILCDDGGKHITPMFDFDRCLSDNYTYSSRIIVDDTLYGSLNDWMNTETTNPQLHLFFEKYGIDYAFKLDSMCKQLNSDYFMKCAYEIYNMYPIFHNEIIEMYIYTLEENLAVQHNMIDYNLKLALK